MKKTPHDQIAREIDARIARQAAADMAALDRQIAAEIDARMKGECR